jgi:hypothetical protein
MKAYVIVMLSVTLLANLYSFFKSIEEQNGPGVIAGIFVAAGITLAIVFTAIM